MTWPITLNGTVYEEKDFLNFAYAGTWPNFFSDLTAHLQNLPVATSSSSVTMASGNISLTVQPGKWYAAGWPVRVYRTSFPLTTYMDGIVSSYDQTSGDLVVSVGAVVGSGTYTDWSLAIGGARVAATLPLSLAEGGTGSTTQSSARLVLGVGENSSDGTAAAPSLSFSADANTGMYRIGTDNIGFATNGVLRLSIGSTGKVGVGTNTINGLFHVYSGASGQAAPNTSADELVIENASNAGISILSPSSAGGHVYFGDEGSAAQGRLTYDHVTDSMALYTSSTARLTITSAGQFQGAASGSAAVPTWSFTSSTNLGMYRVSSTEIGFSVGGALALSIGANGILSVLGSATSPSVSFSGDTNTGIYSPGADQIAFSTGGTARVNIGSSGQTTFTGGTAGAPGVSFMSDTNTGFHNPSADTIAASVGGSNVLVMSGTYVQAIQELRGPSGGKAAIIDTPNTFTAPQRGALSSVAYAATVALDFNTSNNFLIGDLSGPITMSNPTNQNPGQSGMIFLKQDATGGRVITWGTNWLFEGGVDPVLSTAPSSLDVLSYFVLSSGSIICSVSRGFA